MKHEQSIKLRALLTPLMSDKPISKCIKAIDNTVKNGVRKQDAWRKVVKQYLEDEGVTPSQINAHVNIHTCSFSEVQRNKILLSNRDEKLDNFVDSVCQVAENADV